jgi:hypothetical protein
MGVAARRDDEIIPVTLVTPGGGPVPLDSDTAFVRLAANTGHGHADGVQCIACASRGDVRAILFDLLEGARLGLRPAFSRVVLDATDVADPAQIVAALTGRLPAQALRDHTVARRFYLAGTA